MRSDEENLARRAWASKPRVVPGPAIPWPKPEPKPPKAPAAPAGKDWKAYRLKEYSAGQVGYQRALFDFLWQQKAHRGKLGYERKALAQRLQHVVDQLASMGVIEKRYDRFKTWSGKQKICHLTLLTKTDLPENYFRNIVTLSEGSA